MNKFVASVLLGAVLAVASVGTAAASAPSRLVAPERVTSSGPMSFQMFCAVHPRECIPSGATKITLTQDVVTLLQRVNTRVNRSIRPRLDNAAFQLWQINPRSGDCKSYVVSKRHQLIEAGLPASALRIAYVKTRTGEGHAVLVVKTSQGDLTLDNLTGEIVPFRSTGYRVVAMSQADPRRWG